MYKKIICTFCTMVMISAFVPVSYAAECLSTITPNISSSESEIVPYADVIVYEYRIYNGVQQYRRWNETRGYWVDPYWIDVPGQ